MHSISKKIYYHDTDKAGVVYYANYLKYLEEARTEFLLTRGIDIKKLIQEDIFFIVKRVEVDYKHPACYGERIEIFTKIEKVKNASLLFHQYIKNRERSLVEAKILVACVNAKFKPRIIPSGIKQKLR